MSDQKTIPIAHVELSHREISAAVSVLQSGALRQGKITAEFEKRYASATGARHAIAVSSGTAALHLAWLALLRPGDEVLIPTFSFFATASSVVLAGGKPVFCDVDPETFTIDVDDARHRVTPRTAGLAPVHIFGQACDVSAVKKLADDFGLHVVWDAAQAHGTTFEGMDVGSFGDLVCYSFYPTKNMTTGEGGMITTNDDELDRRLRLLRSHGQEHKYYHTLIGLNYRTTDVLSAIGLVQLERLPGLLARRRDNARRLTDALDSVEGIRPPKVLGRSEHAYHQYTVIVESDGDGSERDRVAADLKVAGVEAAVHYPRALHHQPALMNNGPAGPLPVAEALCNSVLSLPVHPALSTDDVDRIVQAVRESVRQG